VDGTGQTKRGYPNAKSSNNNTLKGMVPKGAPKVGTGSSRSANASSNTGRVIDGQNLRGYVSRNVSLPSSKDATVSADGRRRVRKV
jgi:hypothetical protein